MPSAGGDDRGGGGVLTTMRIWQGKTPDGHAVLVERDARQRWVVTVATAIRSRNHSLEAALLEAGGHAVSSEWAGRVVAAITTSAISERRSHRSRTEAS
jgi:hypothetical protein